MHYQKREYAQKSPQNQLEELAMSIENLMKLVSTFQSLAMKAQGLHKQKKYKAHDFYNYDWKDIEALKEQAQVQLYSFASSKYIFDSAYGSEAYHFPNGISQKELMNVLKGFQEVFVKTGMGECSEMMDDLKCVLKSDYQNYYNKVQKLLSEAKKGAQKGQSVINSKLFIEHLTKAEKHTEDLLNQLRMKNGHSGSHR